MDSQALMGTAHENELKDFTLKISAKTFNSSENGHLVFHNPFFKERQL
jgi:hypothetical protein